MPIAHGEHDRRPDRSKLRYAAYVAMYWPRLARGAPKYSPTIAPIVASVAPPQRREDEGQRVRDAELAEDVSSDAATSASTRARRVDGVRPRTVLIITGKNTSTAAIIAFESGLSSPNQLLKIGAKAMIGTEFVATANGISESRTAVARRDGADREAGDRADGEPADDLDGGVAGGRASSGK